MPSERTNGRQPEGQQPGSKRLEGKPPEGIGLEGKRLEGKPPKREPAGDKRAARVATATRTANRTGTLTAGTPHDVGADEAEPRSRRRGRALEDALLDATWHELQAVGYANLTMEGVAIRAGTSKPVLYRRWPNRAQLVLAALRRRVLPITSEVPDTGGVRGDTLALLVRLRDRQQVAGPEIIHGLLAELPDVPREVFGIVPGIMLTVLQRGADRGEVRPDRVTRPIAALPGTLLRHEMMISREVVSDAFLAEIVDDIFLPLVSGVRPPPSRERATGD
jgi:AcrR family transcriptional regulator